MWRSEIAKASDNKPITKEYGIIAVNIAANQLSGNQNICC